MSKELISFLLETMEYNSLSFINDAIEILKVLKIRIERGDKITDEVSRQVYEKKNFEAFVKKHFSEYIYHQVFSSSGKKEKSYFSLEPCEGGYELILSDKSKKVYKWISSLNEKFSLVYMIVTHVVYVKNVRTKTYSPFISANRNTADTMKALEKSWKSDLQLPKEETLAHPLRFLFYILFFCFSLFQLSQFF